MHSVVARVDKTAGGEIVLAAGNDKTLTCYKFDGSLSKLWSIATDAPARSIDLFNGQILLGLKKPAHILQLGASVDEMVNMAAVAVVDAQNKSRRKTT